MQGNQLEQAFMSPGWGETCSQCMAEVMCKQGRKKAAFSKGQY